MFGVIKMTHRASTVVYQGCVALTALNGAWWKSQDCLPGQELNQGYLWDIFQDA